MKSYQLLFDNLIDVNPRTGEIKFSDRRMALVPVEALGILRRDLVNTLGMERAKGFLMRYGWAWGYRDGETIEKMFNWDSKQELILAGPYLHTLEGIVTVEQDVIELNEAGLCFTGFWKNSFEAVEHVNHYGYSEDPICWTLIGYASGYLTKTFGKEVLVIEEQCQGKGDPHCRFVAKTVDEQDKRHQQDLRYYKAESLLSELDRAYKEVQQLNENIIHSEQVQKQLTDMLLADKSVKDTIHFLADTLQKSIVIDYYFEKLECAFVCSEDEEAYQNWIKDKGGRKKKLKQIDTFSIRAHNENLGRLVVIGNEELLQKERMITERALTVFSIQMFHQHKLTKALWRKKEDFFEEILNNNYDEHTLQRYTHIFNLNPHHSSRILTLKVDTDSKRKGILHYICLLYPEMEVFLKDQYIIFVLLEEDYSKIERFSAKLQSAIQKEFKYVKMYIGTGRKVDHLKNLSKSYEDACQICDFLEIAYPTDSRISCFEELEPVIMFLKGSNQQELIEFCRRTIGDLIEHDELSQGNLVITLKSYLEHNGNLQQTADDLHLSIAGLRYRMEKIESLCRSNLKTGIGRFNCQLAVQIYFALRVIEGEDAFTVLKI
ncbi:XylR N-terminal domain-containing protein [Bacillus badius]|uniref:Positive regulator of phenol hydroxylase, DmpR n=1 Tax=Bacillus badius TaxID=1455 RepID=A0ABR5AZV7_BACBA|nr:XylR N-terminal domain-containing protein [Bacillus badius]KIL80273.1 Positive regulator of phenol hydroxylase, DmpR [Bacillus badius]MED4716955.1 XylR N-terminal domain-containing protein [Bacillus badius]